MKTIIASFVAGAAALVLLAFTTPVLADDNVQTITGTAKCAKCAMHEADKCQNVIQAEKDGKTVSYYVVKNDVANDFHENICKGPKQVTATGTVKEVDGKMQLTATKIEVTK